MYKILLVEDDIALHYVYKRMKIWDEKGFCISDIAKNGKEALKKLDVQKFDMIITDIRMPVLDGIGLLKKISEYGMDIYTVILSSYDEFEYAKQAMIYGAADFIVKPLKEKELEEVLERAKKQLAGDSQKEDLFNKINDHIVADGGKIEDKTFLGRILEYIMKYITENKTMEDVALYMELSKDYFGKLCKSKCNITFKQIQTITKMEYAGYLLCNSNIKIYELSEQLGYSTPDYFSRIFTETMGMTPKKYKG